MRSLSFSSNGASSLTVEKDNSGVPMNATDRRVTKCKDGSFCCFPDDMNSTCCVDSNGLWVNNATFELTNFDPALERPSNNAIQSNSSGSEPGPSPSETKSSSNTPAIIGGVGGGVGGLAVVLASAGLLWWRRRSSGKKSQLSDSADLNNMGSENHWERGGGDGDWLVEMDGDDRRSMIELDGQSAQGELEGNHPGTELDGRQMVEKDGHVIAPIAFEDRWR